MKFGKQLQSEQIPGWTQYYLDYKFLKKIVGSLEKSRPAAEAAALAFGIRPGDVLGPMASSTNAQPPLWPSSQVMTPGTFTSQQLSMLPLVPLQNLWDEDEQGSAFQAHKAAFFFKLERELEKINEFYLRKEAELKLRLETLLSKRKAAASRFVSDGADETLAPREHVEWKAVEEGFRLLERDLGKLQKFVDINAIGFRKILKKWDKRSKSTTKELYLSRQVEVQPVFNRQLISELSDIVASCLLDITNVSVDTMFNSPAATDMIFSHQVALERTAHMSAFNDLESDLKKAVSLRDEMAVRELVQHAGSLSRQEGARTLINRILWKTAIEAPDALADIIMLSPATPFDFRFIDDINGRTCLHEAATAGQLRLVELCLQKDVQVDRADVYGRSALHYASMNGHAIVCRRLLSAGIQPNNVDMDSYSPLTHAIISGNVECVKVLLADSRVTVDSVNETNDPLPLSLACQFGCVAVALLLTEHGARNQPNGNGEYPIHLAAREGHTEVCRLLKNHEGYDIADKYNEWTPLFHAAANGHEGCLEVLLEAGCRAYNRDESGNLPVFYAAWNGHLECVNRLLIALAKSPGISDTTQPHASISVSPLSDLDLAGEGETDRIPSLSLPPPIIPFRVYGHNYLDKAATLVQITLGHSTGSSSNSVPAVRLIPRIVGTSTFEFPQGAPSLKLVMTSLPESFSAQHTVCLPLKPQDAGHIFAFQLQSLAEFTLEFSVFPSFGSKTLGRAVALPATFEGITARSSVVLPVLDHRLHVIGQIWFEACVITPFHGVTLEIAGAVETYWKSTSIPSSTRKPRERPCSERLVTGSTHTSPSVNSPAQSPGRSGVTVSSLSGEYVHAVVQVTRDLTPVVFSRWNVLNDDGLDIGIADLTLAQLRRISAKENTPLDIAHLKTLTRVEWVETLSTHFLTLEELLRCLPFELGISLELAYPIARLRDKLNLGRSHDLNTFVDSVLSTVYSTLASAQEHNGARPGLGSGLPRRRLMFSSFAPDVCAALNWKQPNYAVLFASDCGIWDWPSEVDNSYSVQVDRSDKRCKSVAAAVDFAKSNNLLGVFLNASILTQVPSLSQGIKNMGILLAVFGRRDATASEAAAALDVDATMTDGVVVFADHALRSSV